MRLNQLFCPRVTKIRGQFDLLEGNLKGKQPLDVIFSFFIFRFSFITAI